MKPGSVDGRQAPHINVVVFARGMLSHAFTRIYFADEAQSNEQDELLKSVPIERQHTLIAHLDETSGSQTYRFDIHLQGGEETVFFDV